MPLVLVRPLEPAPVLLPLVGAPAGEVVVSSTASVPVGGGVEDQVGSFGISAFVCKKKKALVWKKKNINFLKSLASVCKKFKNQPVSNERARNSLRKEDYR